MTIGFSDKCSKEVYDMTGELMRLAEEDDTDGFFKLAEENREKFRTEYMTVQNAVIVGLMARNKFKLMRKFLQSSLADRESPDNMRICSFLAGECITGRKNREAALAFIEFYAGNPDPVQAGYLIACAAIADDEKAFELIFPIAEMKFRHCYGIALFAAGINKSVHILDRLTDCGRLLTSPRSELLYYVFLAWTAELPDGNPLIVWLENIYEIYYKNTDPHKAYECMVRIAECNGIFMDKGIWTNISRIIPDIYLCRVMLRKICGIRTNDLTDLILTFDCHIIDALYDFLGELANGTAGDSPYAVFDGRTDTGRITALAKRLEKPLTIRFVNCPTAELTEQFKGKVRMEFDLENEKTLCNIRNAFLTASSPQNRSGKNGVIPLTAALIGNGLITAEKLTEILAPLGSPHITEAIYNYTRSCGGKK